MLVLQQNSFVSNEPKEVKPTESLFVIIIIIIIFKTMLPTQYEKI